MFVALRRFAPEREGDPLAGAPLQHRLTHCKDEGLSATKASKRLCCYFAAICSAQLALDRLLDPSDRLAARLARDGDPEPVHIEENDTSFVIDWKGDYRIEGPAFIYSDRQTRRVSTILGYPTRLLAPSS